MLIQVESWSGSGRLHLCTFVGQSMSTHAFQQRTGGCKKLQLESQFDGVLEYRKQRRNML